MMKIKFLLFLVNIFLLLIQSIFSFFPCTKSTLSSLLSAKSLILFNFISRGRGGGGEGGMGGIYLTLHSFLPPPPPPPPQPQNTLSKKDPIFFDSRCLHIIILSFPWGRRAFPPTLLYFYRGHELVWVKALFGGGGGSHSSPHTLDR